jgi:hypothetical protein
MLLHSGKQDMGKQYSNIDKYDVSRKCIGDH